ncbi:MAG: hypothetical protein Q8O33_11265, partial [Pseudomonadota bacterium]|nr:hypothetical protein [Pseudomonadota bacterium]
MPLTENAAPILALALSELLGPALAGSMAYIRCLPGEVARELAADVTARAITADRAVEWREDKAEAVLLLVDTAHAGAGMDGIYSAAQEISEVELFTNAKAQARNKLAHGGKGFADKALSKARRLARNKALSPWISWRAKAPVTGCRPCWNRSGPRWAWCSVRNMAGRSR